MYSRRSWGFSKISENVIFRFSSIGTPFGRTNGKEEGTPVIKFSEHYKEQAGALNFKSLKKNLHKVVLLELQNIKENNMH